MGPQQSWLQTSKVCKVRPHRLPRAHVGSYRERRERLTAHELENGEHAEAYLEEAHRRAAREQTQARRGPTPGWRARGAHRASQGPLHPGHTRRAHRLGRGAAQSFTLRDARAQGGEACRLTWETRAHVGRRTQAHLGRTRPTWADTCPCEQRRVNPAAAMHTAVGKLAPTTPLPHL